jgi:hypothetical protein
MVAPLTRLDPDSTQAHELAHQNLLQYSKEITQWAGGSVDECDGTMIFEVPVYNAHS